MGSHATDRTVSASVRITNTPGRVEPPIDSAPPLMLKLHFWGPQINHVKQAVKL